jgi:hypothetical protein
MMHTQDIIGIIFLIISAIFISYYLCRLIRLLIKENEK